MGRKRKDPEPYRSACRSRGLTNQSLASSTADAKSPIGKPPAKGPGAMTVSECGEDPLGRADVDIGAGLDIEQFDRAVIDDHGIALAA